MERVVDEKGSSVGGGVVGITSTVERLRNDGGPMSLEGGRAFVREGCGYHTRRFRHRRGGLHLFRRTLHRDIALATTQTRPVSIRSNRRTAHWATVREYPVHHGVIVRES